MARFALAVACVVLVSVFAASRLREPDGPIIQFGLRPTQRDILRSMQELPAQADLQSARRAVFIDAIKSRYRNQKLAISVRFRPHQEMEVLCSANIPRWHMSRVALEVDTDAAAVLGPGLTTTVRETYIGMPSVEIARIVHNDAGRTVLFSSQAPERPKPMFAPGQPPAILFK
jgi:hypothetical protein